MEEPPSFNSIFCLQLVDKRVFTRFEGRGFIFVFVSFLRNYQTSEGCERFQLVETGVGTSAQKRHYTFCVEMWVNKAKQGV